jgi:YVTN family beta-propeller protein
MGPVIPVRGQAAEDRPEDQQGRRDDRRTARSGCHRAAFGGLWVTVSSDGTLVRLDPKDGSVVATIPVGRVPRFLAVGSGGAWVMNQLDATVSHVDPKTNQVVATITVGSGGIEGGDIAVGGGSVWVRVSDALIARIDPTTDTVTEALRAAGGQRQVTADHDAVWVSAHDVAMVWRLPLR